MTSKSEILGQNKAHFGGFEGSFLTIFGVKKGVLWTVSKLNEADWRMAKNIDFFIKITLLLQHVFSLLVNEIVKIGNEEGGGRQGQGQRGRYIYDEKIDFSLPDLLAEGCLEIYNEEKLKFRGKPTNREAKNYFFGGKKVVKMVKKMKIK